MGGKPRDLKDILGEVNAVIAEAARVSGRAPEAVEIIGVTKTHGPDLVREALDAGITTFGESRVQEAAWKIQECGGGVDFHLIGHLQSNKVRAALALFPVFHAVDTLKLLEGVERIASEDGQRPEVLLEVNVSGEASKFGFKPDALDSVIERALEMRSLTLSGLMTMAPYTPEIEETRPVFAELRELRDRLEDKFSIGLPHLSMGMSNDYRVAVEEGATWVRLGGVLFGDRPRWKPQQEYRWEP
ncbi:MAG: YggS family pyridoxal phosphate-dependent enzyme [Kiritimatiellae bacterium]|nr:YggS family pyridoxal phosphate-dependent enzyme [Kiritimatiellia bacterium]